MPSLAEILQDPNYVNANAETKRAIFDKYAPTDPNYTGANDATKQAIREKFGVALKPSVEVRVVDEATREGPMPRSEILGGIVEDIAGGARDVVAGALRGAGTIGSAIVEAGKTVLPEAMGGQPAATYVPRFEQRGREMSQALASLTGADVEGVPFKGGQILGETAGTAGVLPGLAPILRSLKVSPTLVQAYETAGLARTAAKKPLADYAARVTGGGAAGATGAAITSPDSIGTGAAVGAALPGLGIPAASVVGELYGGVRNLLSPRRVAEDVLFEAAGGAKGVPQVIQALEQTRGMATTPGFRPTLSERLVEGGVERPTLAAIETSLPGESASMNQRLFDVTSTRVGALKEQLKRIDDTIAAQRNVLAPGARAELEQARTLLLTQLDQSTAQLNQQSGQLASSLVDEMQTKIGASLSDAARTNLKNVQDNITKPAYQEAFRLAGPDAVINPEAVVSAARGIRAMPIEEFQSLSPMTAEVLGAFTQKRVAAPLGRGKVSQKVMRAPEEVQVAGMTLEEANALNQAINIDYASLKGSTDAASNIMRANLDKMRASLNKAIDESPLSDAAKAAFAKAKDLHATQVADKFYSGIAANLRRESSINRPMLPNEAVIGKILGSEQGATELLAAFGNDPAVNQSIAKGVEDLFRQQVVKGGVIDPAAAQRFLDANARQIQLLDNAGVGIGQRLQAVQRQSDQMQRGLVELTDAAKLYKGFTTADELLDHMVKNPSNMRAGMTRLGAEGRTAVSRSLNDRVERLLQQGNPEEAAKLLMNDSYRIGLGDLAHNSLKTQTELLSQTKRLGDSKHLKVVEGKAPVILGNLSPDELTNLERVTRDIQRMDKVDVIAKFGLKSNDPNVEYLATEAAQKRSLAAGQTPNFLQTGWTIARNVWKQVEGKVNPKVAAELATLIYLKPDAAITAIQNAQRRAAGVAAAPSTTARAATAVTRAAARAAPIAAAEAATEPQE